MENANNRQRSTSCNQETPEPKKCWICLSTDDDNNDYENNRDWVSPCKCRGSSRWVHQGCVLRWVDEKLRENISIKVHCPQCRTQYIFVHNEVNYLVQLLNILDRRASRICPILTVGFVFAAIYWSAASYGILTIIQVMGKKEAITMIENTSLGILFFTLPSIPLCLIFGKLINWQRFVSQLPLLRTIMPSFLCGPVNEPVNILRRTQQSYSIVIPYTSLCAAFLLPTNAVIVGNLLFRNSSYSCLQKTVLGGLVYIAVKGAVRIYQRRQNLIKEGTFKVIEYPITDDENN